MNRVFRNVVAFLLGFFLMVLAGLASAETINAESTPVSGFYLQGPGSTTCYGTKTQACNARCTEAGRGGIYSNATYNAETNPTCYCNTGGAWNYGYSSCTSQPTYSCPTGQNWTLTGTTCTRPDCGAGTMRDPATGICITDCNSAASKANTGKWFEGAGSMPGSLCVDGCGFSAPACVGFGGTNWGCQAGAATGQNCSGAGVSQADAAKKACMEQGQGYGTINGITVCSGAASSTKTTGTKTTTTTPPGGSPSSTSKTESTTCEGGKCTTTTTETGPGGTTTGTVEQDPATFCASNPTHPSCKKNEQEDYCKLHPETAGCKELGTAPEEGNVSEVAKGVNSITVVSVASNASCPADIPLPKGMKFEWGPICQWAESLRPVVLALAWLAAGIIVLGGSF